MCRHYSYWFHILSVLFQLAAEARKLHSNGSKCQELGWSCIPVRCGDIWQLGQGGPGCLLQAGILPGHSPLSPPLNQKLWQKFTTG